MYLRIQILLWLRKGKMAMLSVCIITKNEEKNIRRCLASLLGYGFELVVVDTGSTDGTREVVREFTDKLYQFEWCDDFAAAKNFAISKAKHDLVLVVDSDEFLEPITEDNLKKLEQLICQNPDGIGRIRRKNVFVRDGIRQENREWINRIFDRRKFHYQGRIHEQVESREDGQTQGKEVKTWLSPLTFLHTGYDLSPEEKERKAKRNIDLLEKELSHITAKLAELRERKKSIEAAEFEAQIPYLLYQLGKSYYMAGNNTQACEYFDRGLGFDLNPKLEYVIDMVETYGYALLNSGQEQAALSFENIYQEFGTSADFQFLMGLIYMKNARFRQAIAEFEKALSQSDCRSVGVNSYAANYNIGVIYECLGHIELASGYYQKCGNYEPAKKRLRLIAG